MKRKKFIIPIAAVLASMTVLLTACGTSSGGGSDSENVKTVKIAYLPITHALPVYELSQSDNVKVELVKYGSWPELMDALNSGQVDGASVLIELAMQAQSQNIGLKAAALGHTSGNVIVVGNNIQSASDLKGKTFAIPHRSSSHNILLQEMLEQNGLTIGRCSSNRIISCGNAFCIGVRSNSRILCGRTVWFCSGNRRIW